MFADFFGPSHKAGGGETGWFDTAASKQTNQTMKTTKHSFRSVTGLTAGVLTGAVLSGLAPAQAQDAAKPEDKGWESNAGAGLSLSRGNTKNFLATINVDSSRKWTRDEVLLGAKAGYGNNVKPAPGPGQDETRTEGYAKGFGQFNHSFTEKFYGALRADALNDDIADITYRISIAPLAGYYFIKTATTMLSADIGPSWIIEKLVAGSNDTDGEQGARGYLGLRAGERFEHKFASGARIWQTADITPEVENWENYVFNFTIGVSAPITKSLGVQVVADDTYDHQPSPDRLKNDFKLTAGLTYKF